MNLQIELCTSVRIAGELHSNLAARPTRPDLRSGVVAACAAIALEHHSAILILMRNRPPLQATAVALVRVMTEATIRGAWLSYCATDAQVERSLEQIKNNVPDMASMLRGLDSEARKAGATRSAHAEIYDGAWQLLCGFTHTGAEQVLCWLRTERGEQVYADEEMVSILQMINALAKFAAMTADRVLEER